jgi:hypothetical protein
MAADKFRVGERFGRLPDNGHLGASGVGHKRSGGDQRSKPQNGGKYSVNAL